MRPASAIKPAPVSDARGGTTKPMRPASTIKPDAGVVRQLLLAAGQEQLPLRVVYLGGWSPGPELPGAFEYGGLIECREVRASTICTILCSPPGLCVLACLVAVPAVVAAHGDVYGWGAAAACVLAAVVLKWLAVRYVLTRDLARLQAVTSTWHPHVVLAFSWGGAVALLAAKRGVWRGPTVLLNPASQELLGHARWSSACTLMHFAVDAPITLVQGLQDAIVAPEDTERLARTGAGAGAAPGLISYLEYADDHMMSEAAPPATVLSWIVGVLERRRNCGSTDEGLVAETLREIEC